MCPHVDDTAPGALRPGAATAPSRAGVTEGTCRRQQASTGRKPTPSSPRPPATYFDGCRGRIDGFVERNFSVAGSARLHGHAVGWDLLKAPANVALSIPQIGLKLGAAAARGLGARKTADAARPAATCSSTPPSPASCAGG